MEKRRSKKGANRRPEIQAAPLGLIWDSFKFTLKGFFKKRRSRDCDAKKPAAAPSEDSPA